MSKNEKIGIIVTTKHRGVFFGYVPRDADLKQAVMRLEQCRMCVRWGASNRGVVGLAANGPDHNSKITPAAPAITLRDVVSVMECSDSAVEQWEAAPWS